MRGLVPIVAVLLGFCDPLAGAPAPEASTDLHPMVAVVHLHTRVADGASAPADLARAARAAGVEALIVTDHLLERVAYAPWPVGNVIGVSLSRPSVMRIGIGRYFEILREAEAAVPGLVIVPGAEVTPYARFSGSPLRGTLALKGWHRHALVVGIDDPARLSRLPVTGNRSGGVYGPWSLAFALPAGILAWAARRIARPRFREIRLTSFRLRRRCIPWMGLLAGSLAAIVLVLGFPFRVERYSPVGSDPGVEPFRVFTRAVAAAGGVAIWAHPEGASKESVRGVRLDTAPYPDLVRATGAPVFAALPEGTETLLPAGGLWDQALGDFLAGRRPEPVFALAELDEHAPAGAIDFRLLQTVFLVRERTRNGILEALRAGRFYGRWTPRDATPLRLDVWRVDPHERNPADPAGAISGGVLQASGPVRVRFAIGGGGPPVTVRLVRDGAPVWTKAGTPPLAESVWAVVDRPASFRLDVEGPYPYRLVANPIFVVPVEGT